MKQPTEQPAAHQPLASLIAEAVGARQMLPPYERCVELNRLLRAAIGDLYLAAQEQLGRLPEHGRDWHQVRNALTDTDTVLDEGLGSGLLSAAIHLGDLARQARALEAVTP